jgi:hypothetical protein
MYKETEELSSGLAVLPAIRIYKFPILGNQLTKRKANEIIGTKKRKDPNL